VDVGRVAVLDVSEPARRLDEGLRRERPGADEQQPAARCPRASQLRALGVTDAVAAKANPQPARAFDPQRRHLSAFRLPLQVALQLAAFYRENQLKYAVFCAKRVVKPWPE
jgi:hypothetical protein